MDSEVNATWPRRLGALALATAWALAATGCGPDPISGATAPPEPVELVEGVAVPVDAIDNSFRPETVTVQAGTEVVWENRGRNEHDVLPSPPGQGPEGAGGGSEAPEGFGVEAEAFAPQDGTYSFRFTEPGTYHYYCSLHGTPERGMIGTVVVTPGPPEDAPPDEGDTA